MPEHEPFSALFADNDDDDISPSEIELDKIPRRLWEQTLAPLHRQDRYWIALQIADERGDIHVMTASGHRSHRLAPYAGIDESPDWQAIPAPKTARRCGDVSRHDLRDVRARGIAMICLRARSLARRWARAGRPHRIHRFKVRTKDFGGTTRVIMTRRGILGRQLVAFLDDGRPQA